MSWKVEQGPRSYNTRIVDTITGQEICKVSPECPNRAVNIQMIKQAPALWRVYQAALGMMTGPICDSSKALLSAIKEVENV